MAVSESGGGGGTWMVGTVKLVRLQDEARPTSSCSRISSRCQRETTKKMSILPNDQEYFVLTSPHDIAARMVQR